MRTALSEEETQALGLATGWSWSQGNRQSSIHSREEWGDTGGVQESMWLWGSLGEWAKQGRWKWAGTKATRLPVSVGQTLLVSFLSLSWCPRCLAPAGQEPDGKPDSSVLTHGKALSEGTAARGQHSLWSWSTPARHHKPTPELGIS